MRCGSRKVSDSFEWNGGEHVQDEGWIRKVMSKYDRSIRLIQPNEHTVGGAGVHEDVTNENHIRQDVWHNELLVQPILPEYPGQCVSNG